MGRRIQVQRRDIVGLLGKLPIIAAELERPYPMRLQIFRTPDSSYRRGAHIHYSGQAPRAPMSRINRVSWVVFWTIGNLLCLDAAGSSRSRRVLQPRSGLAQKPPLPTPYRLPSDPQLLGNLSLGLARRRSQDDFGPFHSSSRNRAAIRAPLKFVLLCLGVNWSISLKTSAVPSFGHTFREMSSEIST
jgi:hypothetical protein